jgi:hypothetical protein
LSSGRPQDVETLIGKYADLVVLSADPRSVPAEKIAELEVRAGRFDRAAATGRRRVARSSHD